MRMAIRARKHAHPKLALGQMPPFAVIFNHRSLLYLTETLTHNLKEADMGKGVVELVFNIWFEQGVRDQLPRELGVTILKTLEQGKFVNWQRI